MTLGSGVGQAKSLVEGLVGGEPRVAELDDQAVAGDLVKNLGRGDPTKILRVEGEAIHDRVTHGRRVRNKDVPATSLSAVFAVPAVEVFERVSPPVRW